MAPIYETDLAEERFSQSKWNHYELWERVEGRLRRQKRLWIGGAILVFLALSSIPIVMDRWPKWAALSASRKLGQEINQVKREAALARTAYRIRFPRAPALAFLIERVTSCASDATGVVMRQGILDGRKDGNLLALADAETGDRLGVRGLTTAFCYDPIEGSAAFAKGETMVGFGILPVKDLPTHDSTAETRVDRLSVLVLNGPLAEISFE